MLITKEQLNKVLSVLPIADPLAWFKEQSKPFQQAVAALISTDEVDRAQSKVRTKQKQQGITIEPGVVVGLLSSRGLMISTEYGDFTVIAPRADAKYLILYVEDGKLATKSLSKSLQGVKASFNLRKKTHPFAVPIVFDVVLRYDAEEILYA